MEGTEFPPTAAPAQKQYPRPTRAAMPYICGALYRTRSSSRKIWRPSVGRLGRARLRPCRRSPRARSPRCHQRAVQRDVAILIADLRLLSTLTALLNRDRASP